ncbi:iron-containing alcohol dehydrogenase [Breznakiella homolactica]|uniref:Iron-containing alcohol dehydrogenase n=1 Tax=Breznakiella homolactica TaxID=2798577 RepID=A0A7T7XLQ2_9SPIR|nr:iron-containing alcohol dehydrogenase [Breznakiella homolactica]QQO08527.1 iron-containing alcohol dehydrogenase [Breznakiella homolactica]
MKSCKKYTADLLGCQSKLFYLFITIIFLKENIRRNWDNAGYFIHSIQFLVDILDMIIHNQPMENFALNQKTSIYFGKGEEKLAGPKIKAYADSCLVVHDGGDYLKDLLAAVRTSLTDAGVRFFELSGITANPLVSKANEGIEICRRENLGFVLAVGGGSVMDTAKYIASAINFDGDLLGIPFSAVLNHRILPHAAIVTLSGTSSEVSKAIMIIDDRKEPAIKVMLKNPVFCFDFSIVNPELTYSLPPKQLAAGAMDSISHALEVYFGQTEEEPLLEGYTEGVIRTIIAYAPLALKEPRNYKFRSVLSIAAMMAYSDNLANGGVKQDWGCHNIEKPVTTAFHGTHGVVLGILTPSYIRHVYKKNPRPFVNFAERCFGVDGSGKSEKEIVFEGAARLEAWLAVMGLPTHLREIGITADMLRECAKEGAPAGMVYRIPENEIMEIYGMAE